MRTLTNKRWKERRGQKDQGGSGPDSAHRPPVVAPDPPFTPVNPCVTPGKPLQDDAKLGLGLSKESLQQRSRRSRVHYGDVVQLPGGLGHLKTFPL